VYRLKREFRRMADISHENLVTLHELCNEGERWFFTWSCCTAATSAPPCSRAPRRSRRRGPAWPPAPVRARRPRAPRAGKIHRDLKPSNVLVTDEGRVVILDFGLVNEIDHRTLFASSRGLIRGTPAYMAPEQAAGQLATPASDWYAVGAILFEVLTGRFPFVGGAMQIILDKQYEDPPLASTSTPASRASSTT
jgi:serine/threonine protein kinase